MMEKTLILKHISRMLCLLISYSKFTRTGGKRKWNCVSIYGMIGIDVRGGVRSKAA